MESSFRFIGGQHQYAGPQWVAGLRHFNVEAGPLECRALVQAQLGQGLVVIVQFWQALL